MRIVMWIAEILLAVWFFGCICTYQWGSRILVEGMGVKSPEFGMFFMYGAGVVLFAALPAVGKWWLLAVLAAWLVIPSSPIFRTRTLTVSPMEIKSVISFTKVGATSEI